MPFRRYPIALTYAFALSTIIFFDIYEVYCFYYLRIFYLSTKVLYFSTSWFAFYVYWIASYRLLGNLISNIKNCVTVKLKSDK